MHSLVALFVAAAAVCATARQHGGTPPPLQEPRLPRTLPPRQRNMQLPPREYLEELQYRQFLTLHNEDISGIPPIPESDLYTAEEMYTFALMEEMENAIAAEELQEQLNAREPRIKRIFPQTNRKQILQHYEPPYIPFHPKNYQLPPPKTLMTPETQFAEKPQQESKRVNANTNLKKKKTAFALTPLDKGYFDPDSSSKMPPMPMSPHAMHEGGNPKAAMLLQPPRQIRQNPNLSRTKTLVAENLDPLRMGLGKDYRLPVSLLPSNLRWLKINRADLDLDVKEESGSHDDGHSTEKPHHVHVLETANDLTQLTQLNAADSIYGVALIAAVGAALTMAIFGFAFGWYTLSKKAKAAADVDYPAYGVTGPNIDSSGDRKLAHSAHMYHYQHQKQQIIAMERNGLEQRTGSVSDPESEEENEEGDYTVYECPGFASTGDMEVKNPLFSEDPTPATPGKCEVVKPQPKD